MSHLGALMADERFRVTAAIDPDHSRLDDCAAVWPGPDYAGQAGGLLQGADILCIATPPAARRDLVEAAIDNGIRTIFCEKPMAASLDEGEEIAAMVRDAGIRFVVNHSRRWEPGCRRIAGLLASGELGTVREVNCLYTRGISNAGAHMIDLLRWWFGEISGAEVTGVRHSDAPDFRLRCGEEIEVGVRGLDGSRFEMFRIEAFTDNAVLLLDDFGETLSIRRAEPLEADPAIRVPGAAEPVAAEPAATMQNAWDDIHACITEGREAACGLVDGLAVLRVCAELESQVA